MFLSSLPHYQAEYWYFENGPWKILLFGFSPISLPWCNEKFTEGFPLCLSFTGGDDVEITDYLTYNLPTPSSTATNSTSFSLQWIALVLHYFAHWLVQSSHTIFSTNQKWNLNQSWLRHAHFPVLCVSCVYFFSSFDWFTGLSLSFLICQCYYFGFGFTTLDWNLLYINKLKRLFIFKANIASQDYYKKSVEALRGHQLASDTIGKPIRIPYLNLARNDIRVNHRTAQASNDFIYPIAKSTSCYWKSSRNC